MSDASRRGRPLLAVFLSFMSLVAGSCASDQVTSISRPVLPDGQDDGYSQQVRHWETEFADIRADATPVLMAMSDYSVYLPSVAPRTALRIARELDWDPPRDPSWEELRPSVQSLHNRTARLYAETAAFPRGLPDWRFRRALADATHRLHLMAEFIQAYYVETSRLAEGDDGGSTRELLAQARHYWDESQVAWVLATRERRVAR